MSDDFDIRDFTPYLLNLAAEVASEAFRKVYKARYGMLTPEWRVLFHLGRHGDLTARQICDMTRMHKTKVSRAAAGLESRRFLTRAAHDTDGRSEHLSLTAQGRAAFADLGRIARTHDTDLAARLGADDLARLKLALRRLAEF